MFAFAIVAALACAEGAAVPARTIRIDYPLSLSPIGRWTAGTLVGWQQPAPVVHAHDCQAQQVANITIRVPDASRFRLNRAIRAADGTFTAVGMADIASGAGAYIWRISADGESQQAIPTAPYAAKDVAVAPDGFIWTSGIQKQTVRMAYEDYAENHDIVRRFTPDGRPAGSWLPWKSVKTKDVHPGQAALIFASANRVGWYPVRAEEYVEFTLGGQVLGRYPTAPAGSRQQFAGAALCDGGGFFVGRTTHDADGAPVKWEVLQLDRDARSWRAVAGAPPGQWGWVYGCDGSRLVTWSRGGHRPLELDFWLPDPSR